MRADMSLLLLGSVVYYAIDKIIKGVCHEKNIACTVPDRGGGQGRGC